MHIPCVVYVTAAVWSPGLEALWTSNLRASQCTLHFYNDSQIMQSAKHLNVLHVLEAVRPWAYKTDVWRYAMLESVGGIFFDADTRLYRPPERIFNLSNGAVQLPYDRNPRCFYNAIMAAPANSRPLRAVLSRAVKNIARRSYGQTDAAVTGSHEPWLAITGPCTFGAAVKKDDISFVGRHIGPHTVDNAGSTIATAEFTVPKSPFLHYDRFFSTKTVFGNDGDFGRAAPRRLPNKLKR